MKAFVPFKPKQDVSEVSQTQEAKEGEKGNTHQFKKNAEKKSNGFKRDSFEFPEGGWECSKCQNYNFKGRKECFRCKKPKSTDDQDGKPEHMFREKNAQQAENTKQQKPEQPGKVSQATGGKGKKALERTGDWTCQKCSNLNYSFRQVCNRCNLSQKESNEMVEAKKGQKSVFSQLEF